METLTQIRGNIDYKKTKLNDRKQIVENILSNSQNDLEDYFDTRYKASLTSKDKLSHEDNVCRTLESLANYLLNADEIKKEKQDEEAQYMFHTNEQYFQKKVQRENSIEGMSTNSNEDTVIHFLVRSKKNYKKGKTQIVTTADLKREGLVGEVLRQYNAELERVTDKLKKGNIDNSGNRYLLTRASGQIKTDMVIVKNQLLGTFGFNSNPSESTEYDLEPIDYKNENHVKELLKTFCDFEPNSELAYLVMGFEQIAEKADFTPHERHVYNLIRQGLKPVDLAPILNVTTQQAGRLGRIIAKKIAKKATELEY